MAPLGVLSDFLRIFLEMKQKIFLSSKNLSRDEKKYIIVFQPSVSSLVHMLILI
jgi:hypothetical protein